MRTLNRPMFRSGGSTGEGITSGLAPRQGYSNGLSAEQIKEIRDQAKELSYQPRRDNSMNQFLIDFGLNMVSGTPKGNIFATAAEAAKDPMATMQKSRSDREATQYASEADMFKTLIGAQADILGSEGGGKSYAQLEIGKRLRNLASNIMSSREQLTGLDPESDKYKQIQKNISLDQLELNNIRKSNPIASNIIKSDTFRDGLIFSIMERLKRETNLDGSLKYPQQDQDENLFKDAYGQFLDFINQTDVRVSEAQGGRIGYQEGMSVMPTAMPAQEETMPEELGKVSYDELRARLPQEVSDEVVQLLANSAEALEDFATIQTEQDIATFNKKYGVNLVLPAGG